MLHFRKATGVFVRTLPFVGLRIGVGVAFGLLAVAYFAVVAWTLTALAGSLSGIVALLGLGAAVVGFGWLVALLRKYVLYLVGAGHVAVIAHVVETGEAPPNQLRYGREAVADRFVEASALFAVDRLVNSVVGQFNRAIVSVTELAGFVPALQHVVAILGRAVGLAASYVDEAILAHMFLHDEAGPWTAARDGVVLYAKTWKPVLGSTILVAVGVQAASVALFVALTPLASVFAGLAPGFEVLGWVLVAALVVVLYVGVLGPWVKTVVITTYLIEARDETPDSETMASVVDKSATFRDLATRAEAEATDGVPAGAAAGDRPEGSGRERTPG